VEGWKDAYQIQGALEGHDYGIIVTDGTKFNNALAIKINKTIEEGYTPYILSDPDEAGDHLAVMINHHFPDIERINADYEHCKYCKDLRKKKFKAGIEYSSYKYLKNLLYPYLGLIYVDPNRQWLYL
jgi:5S rRNA maturation endonuclease (ribonuclease M5)